jgi:hypothetical protein
MGSRAKSERSTRPTVDAGYGRSVLLAAPLDQMAAHGEEG